MKKYEENINKLLKRYLKKIDFYQSVDTQTQWPAFPRDKRYSPRIDVAVGPFAEKRKCIDVYDDLCCLAKPFLDECFFQFEKNVKNFKSNVFRVDCDYKNFNKNARCFIAIEIEKSGSRKHRLGDVVNVSALGRVGLVIAWDAVVLRSFLRILEYFGFLSDVKKNTFKAKNVAVLEREQFKNILHEFIKKGGVHQGRGGSRRVVATRL